MPVSHTHFDFAKLTPHDRYTLLCGVVVPRPIALITSCDDKGRVNAAPFSFFNVFSEEPAQIVLGLQHRAGGQLKDTTRNLAPGRDFVVNMVDEALAATMNDCAMDFPPDVSEVDALGLATVPGVLTRIPRLAAAPIVLECRASVSMAFSAGRSLLIGEVLGITARAGLVDPERLHVDPHRYRPIGRLAGAMYATQGDLFELQRETHAGWARKKA
jgi:flavin reductase (DIM6/NTAB) family NADH-FMN oxidoreductase RutF